MPSREKLAGFVAGCARRLTAKKELLALNQEVAANVESGNVGSAPGVPPLYPDAKKLVTEDCIKPAL